MKTATFLLIQSFTLTRTTAQNPSPLGICLENYTYPYPVRYITLHLQNETLKMAYMDVRPDQPNGHTILLLHGKNFCGSYWEHTAQALASKGYRVIIPDQIGFGKSSKPVHLQYSFQLLAQNTMAVLDSATAGQLLTAQWRDSSTTGQSPSTQKFIVIGHSMGGMLATRFTLMFPQKVEKLILEDPIGLEDWKIKVPYQDVDTWYHNELGQTYASLKKYETDSYFHRTWRSDYDSTLNIPAGWLLSPEYSRIAWNSALCYDMIFTQPVVYEFGQIRVPTLLLIGQLDRTALGKNLVPDSIRATLGNYPALGHQTQQKIPDCRLIILPGIGHVPHMEDFEKFIRPVLEFVQH